MTEIKLEKETITFKISQSLKKEIEKEKEKEELKEQGLNHEIFSTLCSLSTWWWNQEAQHSMREELEKLISKIREIFKTKDSKNLSIILLTK